MDIDYDYELQCSYKTDGPHSLTYHTRILYRALYILYIAHNIHHTQIYSYTYKLLLYTNTKVFFLYLKQTGRIGGARTNKIKK